MKIKRILMYYLIRLFRLQKGAQKISLGLVFGFAPNWFPTFGLGPMLSVVLARFVRGNIPAALISASFGSFLWPFLFVLNYKVGCLFMNSNPAQADEISQGFFIAIQDVSLYFFVGALLNTILSGLIGYFLFYFLFSKYRHTILKKLLDNLPYARL
ncbi:DUF2062 domain-containing protein [Ammoniphilus sp. CFH 90114]|uniref:DUF2062 domain-containing protein n=1 Tax=Ammoniphilus sp. CFH 90114 TaxID=2493665 RepID=UPI00100F5434|nr:DUF2062 domain-containing protein [Ammoniphilus sp. CFH 90114]RXT04182.1 DUF2062 domain-containing protein [Ammoniphilus sp. CFH 90114]